MFGSKIFQFQTSVNSVRGFKPSKFSKPWIPSTFNQSNTNCTVQHTFTVYTRSHFHTARKSAAICEAKSRFDLEQLFRKKSFFFAKEKSSFGHFDTNRSTVSALFAFRQTAKLTKIHPPTASSFAGFGSKNNYTFENGVFQHLHKLYDCSQASQQSIGLQNTAKKIA